MVPKERAKVAKKKKRKKDTLIISIHNNVGNNTAFTPFSHTKIITIFAAFFLRKRMNKTVKSPGK